MAAAPQTRSILRPSWWGGTKWGAIGAAAEIHVNVPDQNAARVQEVHRTILHVMCEVIESDL